MSRDEEIAAYYGPRGYEGDRRPAYPKEQNVSYPPYGPPQQVVVVQGPPSSGMAVGSLVMGIIGAAMGWCLLGIPCLVAVVLGHGALRETRPGGKSGRGMAIAGLILGYLFGVPWVVVGVASALGGVTSPFMS